MYAIIKNNEVLYITDEIPTKQTYNEDWEIIINWIDYDDYMEYDFIWKPLLVNGEIIEDTTEKENLKLSIITKLWELKTQKDWLELLWEDLTEIENQINNLKNEYNLI